MFSLKFPPSCCLGRHCFGKISQCSLYLLQVIIPSFSWSLAWLCLWAHDTARGKLSLGVTMIHPLDDGPEGHTPEPHRQQRMTPPQTQITNWWINNPWQPNNFIWIVQTWHPVNLHTVKEGEGGFSRWEQVAWSGWHVVTPQVMLNQALFLQIQVSLGWSVRREGWYKLRSGVYMTYKSTVQDPKQSLSKEGQKMSNTESQQPRDCCRV